LGRGTKNCGADIADARADAKFVDKFVLLVFARSMYNDRDIRARFCASHGAR
jgi:hypothetical protein